MADTIRRKSNSACLSMLTFPIREARAGFATLIDKAIEGEFVTITRHGKPVAALVSVEAAEIALKVLKSRKSTTAGGHIVGKFERDL